MNVNLTRDEKRVLTEALRNEHDRLNYLLESLSIDDYEHNGHNIEYDISDLEDVMIKLDIII